MTARWNALAGEVTETAADSWVRESIATGIEVAHASDEEHDELVATSQCLESVLRYRGAAERWYGRGERGRNARRDADQLVAPLRARLIALSSRSIPPVPTPEDQWLLRDRRLVAHTSVSGAFMGAALLAMTISWIPVWSCTGVCGDADVIGAGVTTMIAVPVASIAAVPLVVWSIRLARHRRTAAPGISWPGREVALDTSGGRLRLSF